MDRTRSTTDIAAARDALSPFIGLANGVLASLVLWALIGACALAAYHFAPSWVVTVHGVLLAAGAP